MTTTWPPEYTIRRSLKAKYLRLYIDAHGRIEIVLPKRISTNEALIFLDSKRAWVEKHLRKLARHPIAHHDEELPTELHLRSLHEHWRVEYLNEKQSTYARLFTHPEQHLLMLRGKTHDKNNCYICIEKWLRLKAKPFLAHLLSELSKETGLHYTKFSMRGQKSRWGSCSKEKSITLNYKLIFMPPSLTRHIIIHELCHTVHLNHKQRFWKLVAKHDPLHEQLRKELKTADRYLPMWLR